MFNGLVSFRVGPIGLVQHRHEVFVLGLRGVQFNLELLIRPKRQ
jgi:hypothetical protein